MFDRAWDRVMHSHNKMTGMKMPTMTLFDERWSKVMKRHVEMTAARVDKQTTQQEAPEEAMTTGEMAEHMLTRVEEAVDEDTNDTKDDCWDSRADEEYPYPEDTYDKSWDRVMGVPHSGDISEASEPRVERVEYLAKVNALPAAEPEPSLNHLRKANDPHMQRKLMWLVALCFSYIAYCGFTRLIQQEASQTGQIPDFTQLDLAVSRIFFFTTMTNNNFASFTRKITRRITTS